VIFGQQFTSKNEAEEELKGWQAAGFVPSLQVDHNARPTGDNVDTEYHDLLIQCFPHTVRSNHSKQIPSSGGAPFWGSLRQRAGSYQGGCCGAPPGALAGGEDGASPEVRWDVVQGYRHIPPYHLLAGRGLQLACCGAVPHAAGGQGDVPGGLAGVSHGGQQEGGPHHEGVVHVEEFLLGGELVPVAPTGAVQDHIFGSRVVCIAVGMEDLACWNRRRRGRMLRCSLTARHPVLKGKGLAEGVKPPK